MEKKDWEIAGPCYGKRRTVEEVVPGSCYRGENRL